SVSKTKDSASVRSARGKEAVAQGGKFEEDVAELYRLLGAEVTRNIEIAHKKGDILAVFPVPGGQAKQKGIVECKDGKRAVQQNQRVMQFHSLLDSARKLGLADSAEIITRVPWGDEAKGFAKENDVGLLTYAEKVASLIDFRPYLKSLVERFDKHDDRRP